jgi:diguanylate cyclase (GGDEF)-like protein/PAS domain S-box-containing protein
MKRMNPDKEWEDIVPAGDLSLLDLIALEELQHLQDGLAGIGHVKSVISDPEGHLLTMPSNDIPICRIVRQSRHGSSDCMHTLVSLSGRIKQDLRPMIHSCESTGILKAAVPILINQRHLANWWISQYCTQLTDPSQLASYARRIGIESDLLLKAAENSVPVSREEFEKVLNWIGQLTQKFAGLGYKNLLLARSNSRLDRLQSELDRYKKNLEAVIQARTADLIHTNQRLQLKVMERDIVEEQTARKSKLVDAINQVLQQIVTRRSEKSLAQICLREAQALTASPFGFMVEHQDEGWLVTASTLGEPVQDPQTIEIEMTFEVGDLWRKLIQTGEPVILSAVDQRQQSLLPAEFPRIKTLLAVPFPRDNGIEGFIALADNPGGYALIDQTDITALAKAFSETLMRSRAEQDKYFSEKRLKLALDSAEEGLWDYLPQKNRIYYSPRWFTMLNYNAGELPYSFETWSTLTHPEDLPVLKGTFDNVLQGKEESFAIDIRMLCQSGQWRWVQARGRTVDRDAEGRAVRTVGTLIDIHKYKHVEIALQKANEELQRLAALDDLTQIANRRRFDERLADEWLRARRDNAMLAVILCDIDFFKLYNDNYGHVKGDEALYAVAQAISAILKRPMDLVARYGGEEFAVVLPKTDLQGATRVAKEIKQAVDSLRIPHKASRIRPFITLSFGVAARIPEGETPAKRLVEQADKALYKAKARGRDQIVQAGPTASPFIALFPHKS